MISFLDQLKEYINELENRQRKMTAATEKQNDEICAMKRERETMRKNVNFLLLLLFSTDFSIRISCNFYNFAILV